MSSTSTVSDPFSITKGASKSLRLSVKYAATKVAFPLTGVGIYFTVKARYEDAAVVVQKRTEGAGGAAGEVIVPAQTGTNIGKATIVLTPADTENLQPGTYVCDVWLKLATGEERPVIEREIFTIYPRVTVVP